MNEGTQVETVAVGRPSAEPVSTAKLLEEGLAQGKELVRLEVSLAREEAMSELRSLKGSVVTFGLSAALGLSGVAALLAALVVVTSWIVGVAVGAALLVVAIALVFVGKSQLPQHPMEKTRERLVHDANNVRERLA